jgi:hypothetical protein
VRFLTRRADSWGKASFCHCQIHEKSYIDYLPFSEEGEGQKFGSLLFQSADHGLMPMGGSHDENV